MPHVLRNRQSGIVVNLYFLSGVEISSTGFKMTFHERIIALKDGTMRSASVSRVSISHPTLRRLVKKINQEQGSNEMFIEQWSARIAGPPRKKRYDAVNQRLRSIVENYDSTNMDIKSYLRAIAHNL
ncbi:unnamed protein product [Clavelina lepadiformis]|uniref:Uncharacterized protein n=1 Tax=Clavelina lepadiformis TaxID=159417 RepID=A0ABP0GTQ3_CLALP